VFGRAGVAICVREVEIRGSTYRRDLCYRCAKVNIAPLEVVLLLETVFPVQGWIKFLLTQAHTDRLCRLNLDTLDTFRSHNWQRDCDSDSPRGFSRSHESVRADRTCNGAGKSES
jgi:hypothetical protein